MVLVFLFISFLSLSYLVISHSITFQANYLFYSLIPSATYYFCGFEIQKQQALSLYSCQLQIRIQASGSLLSQTAVAKIFTNNCTKLIFRRTLLNKRLGPVYLEKVILLIFFVIKSPQIYTVHIYFNIIFMMYLSALQLFCSIK